MIYLCITPEKRFKTERLMNALAEGFSRRGEPHQIVFGNPPPTKDPFIVWGQEWLSLRIIPPALSEKRPFWHIDNGFWNPARGGAIGNYRFCYRSMTPIMLNVDTTRGNEVRLKPWRQSGAHILLAMPGIHFGLSLGIDVAGWSETIHERISKLTKRPIMIRSRDAVHPLYTDLDNAWALVTHSSNVAVDAAIAGVPVFVEPTCPARYVGRTTYDFENPITPERSAWIRSLACQQFTIDEMRSGEAQRFMKLVEAEYRSRAIGDKVALW